MIEVVNPVTGAESESPVFEKKKQSFWVRLGGGSLSISILVHAVLLLLAAIWIIRIIPPPEEKVVDFMPTGGGGGSPASQDRNAQKQRMSVMRPNMARVAAVNAQSDFTLPEPEDVSQMSSLGSLSGGGLAGGLGGPGSGGGRGMGTGKGFGDGMGMGMGKGSGLMNPFGMVDPNANALEGRFYDLKQTAKGKPTGMEPGGMGAEMREFIQKGWRERYLEQYYRAKVTLYQTQIYIPLMSADAAPAAFRCEKEVQPSRWIAVYRGIVTPPRSGKFRFVGCADDSLVVRFNNKEVLDHGWTLGTVGTFLPTVKDVLTGRSENSEFERLARRDYPMKIPVTYYQYPSISGWNGSLNGLAVGAEFEVTEGRNYPIEILISEVPGGVFGAALLIQESGLKYEKDSGGSPILPLFRLSAALPEQADGAPPFRKDSPIWKRVQGQNIDI